jgi:hypothetical protein
MPARLVELGEWHGQGLIDLFGRDNLTIPLDLWLGRRLRRPCVSDYSREERHVKTTSHIALQDLT